MGNTQAGEKQHKTGKSPGKGKHFIKNLNRRGSGKESKKHAGKKSARLETPDREFDKTFESDNNEPAEAGDSALECVFETTSARAARAAGGGADRCARSPTRERPAGAGASDPSSSDTYTDLTPPAVELNQCYYSAESDSAPDEPRGPADARAPSPLYPPAKNMPHGDVPSLAYDTVDKEVKVDVFDDKLRDRAENEKNMGNIFIHAKSEHSDAAEEADHEYLENVLRSSPGQTSFTLSKHRKVELPPVVTDDALQILDDDKDESKRLSSGSEPTATVTESNVLRKVASLTLERHSETRVTRPKFVPEKLDFQLYEKFEGQMLLNWFVSSVSDGNYLKKLLNAQDLKVLGIQYCTHLLAAGVLRQITDKDAPLENTFKPNLMYYWAHMEEPVSQPVTPGKLDMSSWPPDQIYQQSKKYEPDIIFNKDQVSHKANYDEINDINTAKTTILELKCKLQELQNQIDYYKNKIKTVEESSNNKQDFRKENKLDIVKLNLVSKEAQTSLSPEALDRLSNNVVFNKECNNVLVSNREYEKLQNSYVECKSENRSDKIENYCKLNKSRENNKSLKKAVTDMSNNNETIDSQNRTDVEQLKDSNITNESSSETSFSSTSDVKITDNNSNVECYNKSIHNFKPVLSTSINISPEESCVKKSALVVSTSNDKSELLSEVSRIESEEVLVPPTVSDDNIVLESRNQEQQNISDEKHQESSEKSIASESEKHANKDRTLLESISKTEKVELYETPNLSSNLHFAEKTTTISSPTKDVLQTNITETSLPLKPTQDTCSPSPPSPMAEQQDPSPPHMPGLIPPPPPMLDMAPPTTPMPGIGPPPPSMLGMGMSPPPILSIGPPPPPMPGMGPPPPPVPGVGPPPPPFPGMGPPPPPMPGMGPPPPPMPGMGPPPPPMPGMGPPPPPMPGIGPPPPPMPGMGPPPPPMPGTGPPPPPIAGSGSLSGSIPPPPMLPGVSSALSAQPQAATGPAPFPTPPVGGWGMQRNTLRKTPIKPAAPMKPLYWTRILAAAPVVVSHSEGDSPTKPLWLDLEEASLDNIDEFTDLFSRQVVKAPVKKKVEVKTKIQPIKILDSKRSQNVGILAQSLHVEFSEIENAIYNFDTSVVSLEALQQIYELRASEEELLLIKEHLNTKPDIPLDKPESFLHDLSGIQNFAERISCFTFQAEFDDAANTIMHKLDNLKHTCEFLMTNESLKQLFAIILTLGNYMNGGNCQRGQADGFGLEILAKLKDVKSRQSNVTLLHFIVRTYMRARGGALAAALPVPEPGDVTRAAALDFADVALQLNTLRTQLDECKDKMKKVIDCEEGGKGDEENVGENTRSLEVFKEKMTTFLNSAEDKLKTENDNLNECRNKFIATVKFYQYSPKCGKVEDCEPKEFFTLWTSFCSDFKDIYKKEEQIAIKEKLKETKKLQCERKAHTQPKKEGGLKARLQKLASTRK